MANLFLVRRVNCATQIIPPPPRVRSVSGPKGRYPPRLSLIAGGKRQAPSQEKNAFVSKSRILEQKENLFVVDFSSQNSKTITRTQSSSTPKEQISQSISTKEETHTQTKNSALASADVSPEQVATRIVKSLSDMCNSVKSQDSVQKGLKNKSKGRFDQRWVILWFIWYAYVVAMQAKRLEVQLITSGKDLFSNNVRADSAKTPHAG